MATTTKTTNIEKFKKFVSELTIIQKIIAIAVILAIIGVIFGLINLGRDKSGENAEHAINIDYLYMYDNFDDYAGKYVRFAGQISDLPSDQSDIETKFITFDQGFTDPQRCIYVTLNDAVQVNGSDIKSGSYVTVVGKVGRLAAAYNTIDGSMKGQLSIVDADITDVGQVAQNLYNVQKGIAATAATEK